MHLLSSCSEDGEFIVFLLCFFSLSPFSASYIPINQSLFKLVIHEPEMTYKHVCPHTYDIFQICISG